jgi:hypothetical protein
MQQGKIRAHRRKIVLALTLALGVGMPPPAQAYVLDFTVASIKPGVLIAHAGGYPSRPPPVGSSLKVVDVSHKGDPESQSSPTIAPPNRILNFPSEPWVDSFSNVCSASYLGMFGGVSPQGSIVFQQSSNALLNMSGGTTLLRGPFGTSRVTETAPAHGNSLGYAAGSNFTANKTDALLAFLGIPRQTVEDNFNPDFAASFSSVPNAFAGTRVPSGNILHRIAPFSSTLMLLGGGLMGLVGLRYRRRRG